MVVSRRPGFRRNEVSMFARRCPIFIVRAGVASFDSFYGRVYVESRGYRSAARVHRGRDRETSGRFAEGGETKKNKKIKINQKLRGVEFVFEGIDSK